MTVTAYPMAHAPSTPGTKLRHHHFLAIVGGLLAVIVVAVTASAVLGRPTPSACHFTCGPDVGPQYLSPTAYTSSALRYRIQYDSGTFSTSSASPSGVTLDTRDGSGLLIFTGAAGSNVENALQQSFHSLNTNVIQDLQLVGPIPGAEIGEVEGTGYAYDATFAPPGGGQSFPVTVMDVAATHGGVTIGVVAVGPKDDSTVANQPFGLANGGELDQPLTDTVWPGR